MASEPDRKNQFLLDMIVLLVCLILFFVAMTITAMYFYWMLHYTF